MDKDESLIMEARKLAGSHIHDVTHNIAFYEDNIAGANRMAQRIALGDVSQETQEDLIARKRLAEAYEKRLRIFVAKQRQANA